ncbi:SDR family oxidoreductase [Compostimonas suwonensis]|uniref:Nucleoside-diphosphate-sugar epimerase n=1 Tax=Compostimonas suwonensis TaxID=1048394 RepID=A0A2M9C5A6_9MICO|nr:NAD(P)H-binding protein [Compostimonas suwonensis]PJJ65657.1 nucleoside-diphosphate-sugar epimerase [Compostimonas suwonensis]
MATVLVTGATGDLGTPTAALLREAGHEVRALSRRTGAGLVTGDLVTGAGIPEAVRGVDTIVHLASGNDESDVPATARLLEIARAEGSPRFVVISIVGIEKIPLGYYRGKLAIEKLVTESGLDHVILRATQFHQFVDMIFTAQRYLPVTFAPRLSVQPIAVDDVAARLVELVGTDAAGRVPDIGGPQVFTARELAQIWKRAVGSHKAVWPLRLPGATFAAFAAGGNLVSGSGPAYGQGTFDDYLAARYPATTL